jgi:hypothetical protein
MIFDMRSWREKFGNPCCGCSLIADCPRTRSSSVLVSMSVNIVTDINKERSLLQLAVVTAACGSELLHVDTYCGVQVYTFIDELQICVA